MPRVCVCVCVLGLAVWLLKGAQLAEKPGWRGRLEAWATYPLCLWFNYKTGRERIGPYRRSAREGKKALLALPCCEQAHILRGGAEGGRENLYGSPSQIN